VELAQRESASSWKEFLLGLKQRGLRGVVCVISDDHAGLRQVRNPGHVNKSSGVM
jgi:putative transposase